MRFRQAGLFVHNDAGQVAFNGSLYGPGVSGANDRGDWTGLPGVLVKYNREGDAAPEMPAGTTWKTAGDAPEVNSFGQLGAFGFIQGPGVSVANDAVFYVGNSAGLHLAAREGELVDQAGPAVTREPTSNWLLNDRGEFFCRFKYAGLGISSANQWAMYFGPPESLRQALRDGDQSPTFASGITLWRVVAVPVQAALNDSGDIVAPTQIQGPGVTDADKVVLWLRHHVVRRWVPLLRSGASMAGKVVFAADEYDFGFGYTMGGGAEGYPPSLADDGTLTMRVEFTDGTHGLILIRPPLFGDFDQDGDVDGADWATLAACAGCPGSPVSPDCAACDLDLDGDVDVSDAAMLQELFGIEARRAC